MSNAHSPRQDSDVQGAANQKKKSKKGRRLALKVIGTLFLIGCFTGVIVLGSMLYYIVNYLDPQMNVDLASYKLAYTSFVYYTDRKTGEEKVLETLYDTENREWVDLVNIPKHMQDAAVAIEDERFWKHKGVDWKRTLAAVANLFTGSSSRFGASTISQQVIKNVTGDDDYSMMRKIEEILRALNLHKRYSHEEILEFYLNTAYFSQNTNGVQAAAKVYFDKDVSELSLAESASIIGITQYPGLYDPFRNPEKNKERQELILWKMRELNLITNEEYQASKAEELHFQADKQQEQLRQVQSWYVDKVITDVLRDLQDQKGYTRSYATNLLYSGGLKIYAAIDVDIQRIMDEKFIDMSTFPTLGGEEQPQASMIIMDPYTGAVLGIAGARGEKTAARIFNYATDAKRQPGSTIKPLAVYAPGIEYNVVTQGSVYDDAPVVIEKKFPRNYDSSYASYKGRMDVKEAVYRSYNTVAMAALIDLGVERSFNFIHDNLGVTSLVRREVVGGQVKTDMDLSPLSLGGVTFGVTALEMSAAYCSFVNKGTYNAPYTYTKVLANDGSVLLEHKESPTVAMSAETAYLINDLLQGVVSYGTGTAAQLSNMAVAAKTGTTSDDVDRWFVGYTPYYVGVVWFGYDQPRTIRYSGTNPALQGWRAVMREVHKDLPYRSFFAQPAGIVSASYCLDSGMQPTDACRNDPRGSRVATANFKKGTTPTEPCNMHVPVTLCSDSHMIASPYCPRTYTAYMLNIKREFPYALGVIDAQYTYLPLSDGYALPIDSSVPVYQNLLQPEHTSGYSPGVDDPMNHLCIIHYGYPESTDRIPPEEQGNPFTPTIPEWMYTIDPTLPGIQEPTDPDDVDPDEQDDDRQSDHSSDGGQSGRPSGGGQSGGTTPGVTQPTLPTPPPDDSSGRGDSGLPEGY
ncbi:MAG: hypothetical protein GXX99_06360 [Clostridiales bacterium]|nr:hypothetical protein [Clostridiales bacterium]